MSTETELSPEELGGLLQELVNRVSHGQGKTLAVLDEAAVTPQQVSGSPRRAEGTNADR